jgi:menaquinone reductase, molybdopterin-binding-like subunit
MAGGLKRRDFLIYAGATVAGVTLGQAGRRLLARADERAGVRHDPKTESWATSVCRECPAACGIRVRLIDGTPVKLEGNPLCPISRGRLCAKGQAAIESYFDPDRLIGPARRDGARGSGRWTPIGWDEAVGLLARGLGRAASSRSPVVALAAEERGAIADAWAQFWNARGAHMAWTLGATTARLAPRLASLTGSAGDPVLDLERATHVLSFGAPVVEDWLSPVWAQRSYGRFRRGGGRPRGRLVQVDSRRSLTARKADEWLPVAADRQALLAYGIVSVLLREHRVDLAFLNDFGGNVADLERDVVGRFTPDAVAAATGVAVVTLLRLARDLAAAARPLVIVAADAPPDLVDAAWTLNALVGSLDRTGGVFEAPARAPADQGAIDAAALLSDLAVAGRPTGVVALRDASALRAISTPRDISGTFRQADLVVSFSPYLDEAANAADLLLPTHTALESWHAVVPPAADPTEKVAVARPAVTARLDTRDLVAVLGLTAGQLGGDAASTFPWKSADEIVAHELDRLWGLRRGTPYSSAFADEWVSQLEHGGWWVPSATTPRAFADIVLRAGGWTDPFFSPGQIRRAIARQGGLRFVTPAATQIEQAAGAQAIQSEPPARSIDAAAIPATADRELPLSLNVFTPTVVNLAGGPNQPVLFELLGQPDSAPWRAWAEINPGTARQFGIRQGDAMRITSGAGVLDVVAVLVERMPVGVVAVAYVPAPLHGGRWAELITADARGLRAGAAPGAPIPVRIARL